MRNCPILGSLAHWFAAPMETMKPPFDYLRLVTVMPVSILICWVPYLRWATKLTIHWISCYHILSIYTYWWLEAALNLLIKCLIRHLRIHPLYLQYVSWSIWQFPLTLTLSTGYHWQPPWNYLACCVVWTLNSPLCFKRLHCWNKMQGMSIQAMDQWTKQTTSFKCPSWLAPKTITN